MDTPNANSDWSDDEIRALVGDLESLQGGKLAAAALIGWGPRAVPFLREFLLKGQPRGVFQPRQLAVETLSELGAKEALVEYLQTPREISDPVVQHAEDAVQSTAARVLAKWQTEDIFRVLRGLAEVKLLPGLVEALGEFHRAEMIPYFIYALSDDVCRNSAREALAKLGQTARPDLIEAALSPLPDTDEETPSSKIRRRTALGLLANLSLSREDWKKIRHLLNDSDPEVALLAAQIALDIAPVDDQQAASVRLIRILASAEWFLQTEAKDCLRKHFRVARAEVEAEIDRRWTKPVRERQNDPVLRALIAIQSEVQGPSGNPGA